MVQTYPIRPSELTPTWLTDVLRASGALGAGAVASFTTEPVGEGVGMLGTLVRIFPAYSGSAEGAPASMIAKFATDNQANRAVGNHFRVYEREAMFLRDVAPLVPSGLPAIYAADVDPTNGDTVIVMEDLGDYEVGDQVAGCNATTAATIIDVLAPLHAQYWGNVDQPVLGFVPRIDGETQISGISGGCEAGWEPTMATFGHLVPDAVKDRRDAFVGCMPELHRRLGRRTVTLIHGDARLDNMMFGTSPRHRPLVLLDWQGIIVSLGTQDLAYLLTQNLTTDERRIHERTLVERYHAALVGHGVTGYSIEDCWDDYRLAALYVYGYGIVIAGTLDPSNERGTAFMSSLIERASAAFVDLHLADLIP